MDLLIRFLDGALEKGILEKLTLNCKSGGHGDTIYIIWANGLQTLIGDWICLNSSNGVIGIVWTEYTSQSVFRN